MNCRKTLKAEARKVLKKHYKLLIAVCLIAAVLGTEYVSTLNLFKSRVADAGFSTPNILLGAEGLSDVVDDIVNDRLEDGKARAEQLLQQSQQNQSAALGRSRGVLAQAVNGLTSGTLLIRLVETLNSLFNSSQLSVVLLIILGFGLLFLFWMCLVNVFKVVDRRIFLEARTYEKMPVQRFLYLLEVRKWWKASVSMLVLSVLQALWLLTIVGGVIKRYSYFLVPYIVAENPDIAPLEAITLSRRMMNGHKWECFCLELSFLGWGALGMLTFGLSAIFFSNAYRSATLCAYYVVRRQEALAQVLAGSEALNDRWLYEQAASSVLRQAYAEASLAEEQPLPEEAALRGVRKFLADVFGIAFFNDKAEKKWQARQEAQIAAEHCRSMQAGLTYPQRLSPLADKKARKPFRPESMHYVRHYSLGSLVLLFFILSFVGWLWEVSLCLVTAGELVNRGFFHGPWLPIYGGGSVLILVVLNKLRKSPLAEFVAIIVLCGAVEYATAWYLELAHDGMRWWDYTGYFLNLHGRICAEGLLVFGIGGMIIVYYLAPHLDSLFRRIPRKTATSLCIVLLTMFGVDVSYSLLQPNMGEGVTGYVETPSQDSRGSTTIVF